MTGNQRNSSRRTAAAAIFAATLSLGAAGAWAAPQPKIATPAAPPVLPNTLYLLAYAVSDHTAQPQQSGSGVTAETLVSIGLGEPAATAGCRVQLQWIEWSGAVAGYSGPAPLVGADTLEFTTVFDPAVIITPFNQNVFSNIAPPRTFEGHARIRSDCPSSTRLRIDAKYVTNIGTSTSGVPSSSVKRHEIKVIRPIGNVGD